MALKTDLPLETVKTLFLKNPVNLELNFASQNQIMIDGIKLKKQDKIMEEMKHEK